MLLLLVLCGFAKAQSSSRPPSFPLLQHHQRGRIILSPPSSLFGIIHLRGGVSPFRQPATPSKESPGQTSPWLQFQQQQQQQQQTTPAQEAQATAEATKEVIDAFLTRDSRNTFIGG
jgi:hypothetical protein